jgi:peptidoglycan-N-acetylglucosamine deacetylase
MAPEARAALAKHIQDLDGVIGEWLNVDSAGKVSDNEDPDQDDGNPSAALKFIRGVKPVIVLGQVSDMPSDQASGARGFLQLGDPYFRSRVERELLGKLGKFNFDRLVINFDDPRGVDQSNVLKLLHELHEMLSPLDKKIGVVLPGDWQLDYKAFSAATDLVVVELYNEGATQPGPLAADEWWRGVVAARTQEIPTDKLIFSFASTGRDWTPVAENGVSQPVSFGALMLIAASERAGIEFDIKSENPHFNYIDGGGVTHDIWFLDGATAFNQLTSLLREPQRA